MKALQVGLLCCLALGPAACSGPATSAPATSAQTLFPGVWQPVDEPSEKRMFALGDSGAKDAPYVYSRLNEQQAGTMEFDGRGQLTIKGWARTEETRPTGTVGKDKKRLEKKLQITFAAGEKVLTYRFVEGQVIEVKDVIKEARERLRVKAAGDELTLINEKNEEIMCKRVR